jgi:hypothetical protein
MNEFCIHTMLKNSLAGGVLIAALGLMAFGHVPEIHAAPRTTNPEPKLEHIMPLKASMSAGYSCEFSKKPPCLPIPALRSDIRALAIALPRGALK